MYRELIRVEDGVARKWYEQEALRETWSSRTLHRNIGSQYYYRLIKLYKIYYKDTGLLIASLDEEAQEDLRANKNLGTYKGAIYENIVGDMLVKQGYNLYYYSSDRPSLEMDFFVRDTDSLIPVEVKANDGATASLNKLLNDDKYSDVKYGIKLGYKNIGFNGKFYTLPYFLTFLLKRFVAERNK